MEGRISGNSAKPPSLAVFQTCFGAPLVHSQPFWPSYQRDQIMSLRPGDASVPIPSTEFAAEHNCAFWNSIPGAIGG